MINIARFLIIDINDSSWKAADVVLKENSKKIFFYFFKPFP